MSSFRDDAQRLAEARQQLVDAIKTDRWPLGIYLAAVWLAIVAYALWTAWL